MSEHDIPGLTDGRQAGDFFSRYPRTAWVQILLELLFLLVLLATSLICLLIIGYEVCGNNVGAVDFFSIKFELPKHRAFLIWFCIGISGAIGGTTFALKWLYHSVAKFTWNRDRILWRFTVPVISAVLALFSAFMIVSGIVPFLSRAVFNNFYIALGFGFFTGYFSDNVLAALQRLAQRTFGTVDDPPREEK